MQWACDAAPADPADPRAIAPSMTPSASPPCGTTTRRLRAVLLSCVPARSKPDSSLVDGSVAMTCPPGGAKNSTSSIIDVRGRPKFPFRAPSVYLL